MSMMRVRSTEGMRWGRICLDDGPSFEAWIECGTHWNGFLCPYLSEWEIRRLKAYLDECMTRQRSRDPGMEFVVLEFDAATQTWIERTDGDPSVPPTVYEPIEIGGVRFWDIGRRAWCWWDADKD